MSKLDNKRRKSFELLEYRRKVFQAVARTQELPYQLRWRAQFEKSKLPRQGSLSRIHNHCLETDRARAIISFYKLSRLEFRRLVSKGVFTGFRKACW
uniref:Ribosomal protein S14 n=1 Tax=Phaeophyceae sp. TaxID=2249243 RepID=A0A8E8U4X3_9PHAE|nr:ribosomal protein S14 [Phaeophyceae sp.]